MTYRPEIVALTKPFPDKFIHDDGRGNAYVPHHIVNQRFIHIFGAPPKIELLREIYDDEAEGGRKLTGVVMRLTVPGLEPVEEGGEADNPQSKTNGARLKDACSDALKRCAMRLGCGLHLWSQADYYLYDEISKESKAEAKSEPSQPATVPAGSEPQGQPSSPASSQGGSESASPEDALDALNEKEIVLHILHTAVDDGIVSKPKVTTAANEVCLKEKVQVEGGFGYGTLHKLPLEVLQGVVEKLKLNQEVPA